MTSELPTPIRALYPFESHYLDLDGVRMHYVDEGSGPAVLMLHGNPTWSFYYRDLVLGLRARFRVIAPDHVGCGLSDKPSDYPYTLARHTSNLSKLVEALDLRDVALMVHDWGGAIGFGWAVGHPKMIKALVVTNTAAFTGGRCPWRIRVCRWPVLGDVLVRVLNGFARAALIFATAKRERMTPAVQAGLLYPYDSYAHRIAIQRFVRDIPLNANHPSYDTLRRTHEGLTRLGDKPMSIYWGAQDFCFDDRFLAEWIRLFPAARVRRFADAGHYVVQDAHEEILPDLESFLQEHLLERA